MRPASGWRPGCTCCAALLVLLTTAACSSPPAASDGKDYARALPEGVPALEKVQAWEWPDLQSAFAEKERVLEALDQSLEYFTKPSSKKWFPYRTADREITHEDQLRTLEGLRRVLQASRDADEFAARCRLAFDCYRSVGWNGSGEVLITAYCEPIFNGRRVADEQFRYPLYRLPPDLVKDEDGTPLGRRTRDGGIVPYHTRGVIESEHLMAGRELVWLADPFEVYIAHVQGSARVNLPDGTQMCVGYAGKTERPYTSIGRRLVEEGRIRSADLSLATLKRYFREHPEELARVLPMNESYVFFMEREPGPFGSIGARVTPYHSLATDKSVFPRGGPCIVSSRLPVGVTAAGGGDQVSYEERTVLAFDQDTGGAIRSAGRADLFIGTGHVAEQLAGYTREEGRLHYLFIRERPVLP